MSDIEVGQVLSLKVRFNNSGEISAQRHPYLVVDVNEELGIIEIAQLDSLKGKEFKAAMKSNEVIFHDNPIETVIDKDSYIQLDNTFKIEDFPGLSRFRRQREKLSERKLSKVLKVYNEYHISFEIDENKNIYMSKSEILELNN